jgi:hypothetical protein
MPIIGSKAICRDKAAEEHEIDGCCEANVIYETPFNKPSAQSLQLAVNAFVDRDRSPAHAISPYHFCETSANDSRCHKLRSDDP